MDESAQVDRDDSDGVRREFQKNGFFVAREVFSSDELIGLEADFDRIVGQLTASGEQINATWSGPEMDRLGAAGTSVLHTHNVQQFSAAWLRAFLNQKFLAVATAILGEDVVLHHSKLFQKPSEVGSPFPVHQDWTYFPSVDDTMIAAIIHVSSATDEMGCLRVVPGSHRLGRVADSHGNVPNDLLANHPLESAIPLEANPGDVVFFHYFLLHGSMPNRSAQVRKTVLVQMHAGSDRIEDGVRHPNERLVLSGWNHHATRSSAGIADKGQAAQ